MRDSVDTAGLEADELSGVVARVFAQAGYELYLVGGAVRNRLLAQEEGDLDFATSAPPGESARLLASLRAGEPYRIGEKFGTIGLNAGGRNVEVTTYRSRELYSPGSRKPEVRFGSTLLEDLSRRDFTINAIALDPLDGRLVDPLGGEADLAAGLIRAVGSAEERFREDPLRLLRAVRFASRLEFDVESETWNAMRAAAHELATISRERIRDEYSGILEGPDPVRGMSMLRASSLLAHSVPELLELTRMPDHGPRHPLSLWDHTMRVLAGIPPLLALRWAALLHDIGKPATRTHEPSGRPRFFHHEDVGAALARDVLSSLRYSNSIVDAVVSLVETHMQLHAYSTEWSDGAVRRLMLRLGPLMEEAIQLAGADGRGHSLTGEAGNDRKIKDLETRVRALQHAPVESLKSPLSGDDLMRRYDRPPGPWIREIKDALLDEVLEGRLSPEDREGAWKIADSLAGRQSQPC